ncbi:uncharacterized protein LOC115631744 [Scaptodrosophila lebanonensis]|uniref:Uncharacterized protein LOC115631744 n=1 Tax=Drosophila lebanonensis TaxID=7225 RepID=A0A6J2UAD5_DROLE|nr:uncharacterized protein LOC115631744 [Scaptodrosophila lebanonensis]
MVFASWFNTQKETFIVGFRDCKSRLLLAFADLDAKGARFSKCLGLEDGRNDEFLQFLTEQS